MTALARGTMRAVLAAVLLTSVAVLTTACAVKPPERVAAGQDRNLYRKEDLLGRPLAEVAGETKQQSGKPAALAAMSDMMRALVAPAGVDPSSAVTFDLTESFLTISVGGDASATPQPKLQFKLGGHFDLKPQTNADGVKSQYLVKDDNANARWQDREFVEIDATDPLVIKADEDTLRYMYLVAAVKDRTFTVGSDADLPFLATDRKIEAQQQHGVVAGTKVTTKLSQRHFSLYKHDGDAMSLVAQAPIRYFDLVRKKNSKEEQTSDLERDQAQNEWFMRLYVEIDPDDVKVVKPAHDLMENLFEKTTISGKRFVFGKDAIPVVSADARTSDIMRANKAAPVTLGAEIELKIGEHSLDVMSAGKLVAQFTILGHVDITTAKAADGEELGDLVRNNDKPWAARRYIHVDPRDAELPFFTEDLLEGRHKLIAKVDLGTGCFKVAELPSAALADAVRKLGAESDETVCIDVTQTVLSVSRLKDGKKDLIATFAIESHFDIDYQHSADGRDTLRAIARSYAEPKWESRTFVSIDIDNPQVAESKVQPDALAKSVFDGEFVYTATVVAAHSENGLVFEGLGLQSPDRLKLELSEDALTAYKVHEPLNNSQARTPVLRYGAEHFDIERVKNYYGDRTNVTAETHEGTWDKRGHTRVDFASNQIATYFNDLLGIEKLYSGIAFISRPRQASPVKIEGDMISFETEEVVTPNARSGYFGVGETMLEPVAIRIKHAFLRVGARGYAAKEYDALAFSKFGYFRVTEAGLDPERGKTDQALKNYIQRFDVSGDKQIHYYLSAGFPETFKDEARGVISAWNDAFKAAVGRDNVVVLHEDMTPDFGDPRYNMIVYIPTRSEAAPLGYGPAVFDPTTGEHISAKAYMYGDTVKLVMRMASDYYDLATGARSPIDFAVASEPSVARTDEGPAARLRGRLDAFALPRTVEAAKAAQIAAPGRSPDSAVKAMKKLEAGSVGAAAILGNAARSALPQALEGMMPSFAQGNQLAFGHHQGCAMSPEYHLASAIKFIAAHPGKTKEEVMAELESRMFFTTLIHEVGHNLGLRHNFQGSFDELSFPPEYHLLKVLNQIGLPDPIGDGEWIYKYRGSSVMEYSDDYEALYTTAGLYDIAAIKFGYGDKLEQVTGRDDAGALTTQDIPVAQFEEAKKAISAAEPGLSAAMVDRLAQNQLSIRPYMFCTDEHTYDNPTCARFDRGVTVAETTQSLVEDYETLYYLYGFRRDRRMFTGSSSRVIGRFIMPVRQLVDEYIYRLIMGGFTDEGAESQDDFIDGVNIGISFFKKILDTIEPGDYHLDATKGELVAGRSDEEGAKNVVIDLMSGKYLKSMVETIGNEEKVLNRGVELDKIGVLWAMSMRGFPAPKYERISLSLNYFDLLKNFTIDVFSGLMREEYSIDVTAVRAADGADFKPASRSVRFDPANPNHLKAKIRPSSSLAIREYATLFAVIDYNNASDRTFADYLDFRVKGEDAALPEGTPAVEFRSASGLKTYVVGNTADGKSISFAIAKKAAAAASSKAEMEAALAALPKSDELKVRAIATFADAWAIGEGEPMADNVRAILQGNFDRNIPVLEMLIGSWIEAAVDDPEKKAKLEALAATLSEVLTAYAGLAAQSEEIQNKLDDAVRELTRHESDLLHMQEMYDFFN